MLHFSRSASILAALLACVTPAGARLASNGASLNGVSLNRLASNGLATNRLASNGVSLNGVALSGSALGDLNGVVVEAVVIPEAAIR